MFENNRICKLFRIRYPIVQAGMVWCSGWKLASEVSNAGGLGLLGAGSMSPEILQEHILKSKSSTKNTFGVNLPLFGAYVEDKMEVILRNKVKVVFTSAGNPMIWTPELKKAGAIVVHVVSSGAFAAKAENAGVDAIVAEGFEAGGHNGREETTSFVLLPTVKQAINIPLIAAGGMYSGASLAAANALGADGIQVGSRFAISSESSAHPTFKKKITEINEGDTRLVLKKLTPVRLVKNEFYNKVVEAEEANKSRRELLELLGNGRSKLGIFEGNLTSGELEIGQISSLLEYSEKASYIVNDIVEDYKKTITRLINANQ